MRAVVEAELPSVLLVLAVQGVAETVLLLEMDLMQRSIQAAAVAAPTATHRGTAVLEVPALSSFDMQTLTTQQLPQLVRRP